MSIEKHCLKNVFSKNVYYKNIKFLIAPVLYIFLEYLKTNVLYYKLSLLLYAKDIENVLLINF